MKPLPLLRPGLLAFFLVAGLFSVVGKAAPTFEIVHGFTLPPTSPAGLVRASDGFYWGVSGGGPLGFGTVFKVSADGAEWRTVAAFTGSGPGKNGSYPGAALVEDGAGFLWGSTSQGGTTYFGTIFKIHIASGVLTTVLEFTGYSGAKLGLSCYAPLVRDGAGFLWGVTSGGGVHNRGTIFKIHAATGALTTVLNFDDTVANEGSSPTGALFDDGAGNYWGTTQDGGPSHWGTVFKYHVASGVLTTPVEFTNLTGPARGTSPSGALVSDGAGFLWGTAQHGGAYNYGTVFKIEMSTGMITTVTDFNGMGGALPGRYPIGALVNDGAGALWGATYDGGTASGGTIFKVAIATGVTTTAVDFGIVPASGIGGSPQALIAGSNGELLGTLYSGEVFKFITASGALSRVVALTDSGPDDRGRTPLAGLASDGAGRFWGTTTDGGSARLGTVFKVDEGTGTFTTTAEFTGPANLFPKPQVQAALTADGLGVLWGTTPTGGAGNFGTVFKVDAATGAPTTVLDFTETTGSVRGSNPQAALVADGAGFLWGTTASGGSAFGGTVFKIAPATNALTTVVEFAQFGVGPKSPQGKLVSDGAGYFWGTSATGGVAQMGTIFKIHAATGAVTTVVDFNNTSGGVPGSQPLAGLVSDGAGSFWGTTRGGGAGSGTIFKVNATTNAFTPVLNFTGNTGAARGGYPRAEMIADGAGFLWGTTQSTIFKVNIATGAMTTIQTDVATGYGALLHPDDGHYYGTMQTQGPGGGGAVFRLRVGAVVATLAAAGVGPASARLRGTVDGRGTETTVVFEWGTAPNALTQTTPVKVLPASYGGVNSQPEPLAGLAFATTYFYRIRADNPDNPNPQRGAVLSFTTAPNPDPDGDGLPDAWELAAWGQTAGHSALDDGDHDGVCELLEYAFSLDPNVSDAVKLPRPALETAFFATGRYLTLHLPRRSGVVFTAETTGDLKNGPWSSATTVPLFGLGATSDVRDIVPLSAGVPRFMRVKVTADPSVFVEP